MTFNNETSVLPCEDGHNLPTVQFDFTKIDDLENKPKDSLIGKPVTERRERGGYHPGKAGGLLTCLLVTLWSCRPGSLDRLQLNHCACVSDIIGICKSYEDAIKITVKSNNREVSKRNIYLMDMSGKVVSATLWGEDVSICVEQSKRVQRGVTCPGDLPNEGLGSPRSVRNPLFDLLL